MSTVSQPDDKLDAAVLRVAGVVVLGAIMSILDITVVSVAQPTFQDVFDASPADVAWSMTGYTLALATVIPLTGWAADRFGTKRLYLLALSLFVVGSLLCAMAWDVTSLIGFRVVQGLGGGMLMPLGMTIMTRAAGPHRVGRVMAVLGIPMLLDRKSTRLNSSHVAISYAVFCPHLAFPPFPPRRSSDLSLFVVGSLLCAMAWDVTSLIGFRVVQGLGGGMLMPLGMTIMTRAAGPHRVGRVMAVLGIPML